MSLRLGSLFSGYGGLDLAVHQVFGDVETAWVSDIEPGPCKVLAHRFPGVQNLGDITKVDWHRVPQVDLVCGGSPCQDISTAGRLAGMTVGTRSNLWAEMREAIRILRPRYVIWENVRGALSARADSSLELGPRRVGGQHRGPALRALGRVLGDLADLRYDAIWYGLRAADVGAPHGRFRIFLLAADTECGTGNEWGQPTAGQEAAGRALGATPRRDRAPVTLLPTPAASNFNDGEDPEQWEARRQRVRETAKNGNGMGMPLGIAVQLLPTPKASNNENRQGLDRYGMNLGQALGVTPLLPTPRATDGTKGGPNQRGSSGDLMLPSAVMQLLPTPRATGGGSSTETVEPGAGDAERERQAPSSSDHSLPPGAPTVRREPLSLTSGETGVQDMPQRGVPAPQGQGWGPYRAAVERWEAVHGPAPPPTKPGRKGRPKLNPEFASWMMGVPAGWITDVPGVTDNESLKMAGNGVVPQQAVAALRTCLAHLEALGGAA